MKKEAHIHSPKGAFCVFRSLFVTLLLMSFWLAPVFLLFSGCGGNRSETNSSRATGTQSSGSDSNFFEGEESISPFSNTDSEIKSGEKEALPPLEPGKVPARDILQQMLDVYSKCKVYVDDGYFEIVYDRSGPKGKQQVPTRYPCSVSLKKPNLVRLAVRSGELYSDGSLLRARITLPSFEGVCYETKAPRIFSSVRDFYPNARLAAAMRLDIPASIAWSPPQLTLLFAKNPLKTFLSGDEALPVLLPPAYAGIKTMDQKKENIVACDRIQITSENGNSTLWICRKDRTLVRMEFPLEQLAVPDNVNRINRISLEIPNRQISTDPNTLKDERIFSLKGGDSLHKVQDLLPTQIAFLGQTPPKGRCISLVSGFPDFQPHDKVGKVRLYWFFNTDYLAQIGNSSGESGSMELSRAPLVDILNLFRELKEEKSLEIIPVSIEDPSVFNDRMLRQNYGALNLSTPLYRLNPRETSDRSWTRFPIPSFMLQGENGIVQRLYRQGTNRFLLFKDIQNLLGGQDLYTEELALYKSNVKKFQDVLRQADLHDIYRVIPDSDTQEVKVKPKTIPQKMKLEKIWTVDGVRNPCNPIFIPRKKNVPNAPINDIKSADLIIVPCRGNNIQIFSIKGDLLKTIDSTVTGDEPITFLRSAESSDGKRFYAASSLLGSRKIHCFDEAFKIITTINIGYPNSQRVADVLLEDLAGSPEPELVLALVGDSANDKSQINGLYAVDIRNRNIIWKDENVTAPYRIEIESMPNGEKNLLSMNLHEGILGNIVVDNLKDGKRLGMLPPLSGNAQKDLEARNNSIFWMANRSARKVHREVPVLVDQLDIAKSFFAGISLLDGRFLWRTAILEKNMDRGMERIVAVDLNADGHDEWILPYSDGTLLFFDEKGAPQDRFQYGAEVTGVCTAQWNGIVFLIVTDPENITAWKISK